MNEKAKGDIGESRAARFLEDNGYRVLARKYRSNAGEIDIIAREKNSLVFVEVKRWKKIGMENLEYAINAVKKRRIIETSRQYMYENPEYGNFSVRYDVVLVYGNEYRILHIDNAFSEVG